ncbi:hypothetical protein JNK13_11985 [bacterium]|nr:hypothetical protein [bacterium]
MNSAKLTSALIFSAAALGATILFLLSVGVGTSSTNFREFSEMRGILIMFIPAIIAAGVIGWRRANKFLKTTIGKAAGEGIVVALLSTFAGGIILPCFRALMSIGWAVICLFNSNVHSCGGDIAWSAILRGLQSIAIFPIGCLAITWWVTLPMGVAGGVLVKILINSKSDPNLSSQLPTGEQL